MRRNDVPDGRPYRPGRSLFGLLAVNVLLLGLLGLVTFQPASAAQTRSRGDYTMVGANVNGALADVIFVVDVNNQEMIAIGYEPNQRELFGVGYRNLAIDAQAVLRGASR